MGALLAYLSGTASAQTPPDTNATLVYYNASGNQTLDPAEPQNNSSYAHDTLLAVYDPLIRLRDDGTPAPGLAESWNRDDALTTLTLKLRPAVKFHDGAVLDAQLVARNFERQVSLGKKANSGVRETVDALEAVDILDPLTIRLRFKAPNGQIETWLGGPSGMMLSPAAFADGAFGAGIKPLGAGPYRVKSFESNVRMIAERFDAYWGGTAGRPAGFEHHYVPDGRARLNAVRSGQATVALLDSRQVPEARSAGMTVQANDKNAFWVLYFNKTRAHGDDVRVRQAFMYAIDREALAEALTFGTSQPARQLFAKSSPLHVHALDGLYKFDPPKARALMAEAGLKSGLYVSMLLLNNSEFRPLAEALQSMLGDVGIRLTFDPVDVSQFTAFFLPPPRGDAMLGRYGGRADPLQMLYELVGDGGPFSPGGSKAPELDRLIQKAKTMAASDPARLETLRALAAAISEHAALVPVMTRANVYAFKPGCVTGLSAYLPGGADRFNDVQIGAKCR